MDNYAGHRRNPNSAFIQIYTFIKVLLYLGVDVGLASKVFGPSTHSVLTGYSIDSVDFTITLKPGKPEKIIKKIDLLLSCPRPELILLQQVAGDLAWASKVFPGTLAMANPLHIAITLCVDFDWKNTHQLTLN